MHCMRRNGTVAIGPFVRANVYTRPGEYCGNGKSASANGTKWNLWEKNLLSEYHMRYGDYGGVPD